MRRTRVPVHVAGLLGLAASLGGAYLAFLGLAEAQPLVTFGVIPTEEDLRHGRWLLALACLLTVAGGAIIAGAGRRVAGVLVALPAPAALALTYAGPPSRGFGWAGLLLSVVAIGVSLGLAASRVK
jgi:hypothetical protein